LPGFVISFLLFGFWPIICLKIKLVDSGSALKQSSLEYQILNWTDNKNSNASSGSKNFNNLGNDQ